MRSMICAVAAFIFAGVASAQVGDGNPNSYCTGQMAAPALDSEPWRISDDVEDDIATPGPNDSAISVLDIRRDLDVGLQSTSRIARHKFRSRITWTDEVNCTDSTNVPCIFTNGAEDSICAGTGVGSEGAVGGHANCDFFGTGRCWIVLCGAGRPN